MMKSLCLFFLAVIAPVAGNADNCPSKCHCTSTVTRCIYGDLKYIPVGIPVGTRTLDLRFNEISVIENDAFSGLVNLQTLLLNNNHIRHIATGAFHGLSNLTTLYLYGNQLTDLPPPSGFRSLRRLHTLYLHSNQLGPTMPLVFFHRHPDGYLPTLDSLYLNDNQITSISSPSDSKTSPANDEQSLLFHSLAGLSKLRLDGNPWDCTCRAAFGLTGFLSRNTHLDSAAPSTCTTPTTLRGRQLNELTPQDLRCQPPEMVAEPMGLQRVDYGQRAELTCQVKGDPKAEIRWIHNNTVIDDDQFQKNDMELLGNGSLTFHRFREGDQGSYQCLAKNSIGIVRSKRAQVNYETRRTTDAARSSGPIIIRGPPRLLTVALHQSIQMDCTAAGNPRPRTVWHKDGTEVIGTNNIIIRADHIIVRNAQPGDAGTYTCIATNSLGTEAAAARVVVSHKPKFILTPRDQAVREGTQIKFECETLGSPAPNITWLINDRPVQLQRRIGVSSRRRGASTLTIYPIQKQDAGKFTCQAANQLGNARASASLRILESVAPRVVESPVSLTARLGETIRFRCRGSGYPRPDINWTFNGSPLASIRGRLTVELDGTLVIQGVTRTDAGVYKCEITNDIGIVTAGANLKISESSDSGSQTQTGGIPNNNNNNDNNNNEADDGLTDQIIRQSVATAIQNVDRAINKTRSHLYDGRPKTPSELLTLFRFPQEKAIGIARAREVYEETLEIIHEHVNQGMRLKNVDEMQRKDVEYHDLLSVSHLQLIMELSGCVAGQFTESCSDMCHHSRYRSYDGQCNNLDRPLTGISLSPFKRNLPPIYENKFNTPVGWNPARLYYGHRKPNARQVSIDVISTGHTSPDNQYSAMMMQWGQFLDHDMDFSIGAPSRETFESGAFCNETCRNVAPCFNIQMPVNDPRRNRGEHKCIALERSSAVCGSGASSLIFNRVAQREQINAITSYIDGSQIYGSSETEALNLRDLFSGWFTWSEDFMALNSGRFCADHGLMRFDIVSHAQKPYLPFNRDDEIDCQRNETQDHPFRCFQGGDVRANEQLGLLSMHTLWLREHNRIAANFLQVNPHWDGEKIFQETRKIVGGILQHITFGHWLPKIFGPHYDRLVGKYMGYNDSEDASISNAFATAAFRFGHGMINPLLYRYDKHFTPSQNGHLPLHQAFFSPERLLSEGGIDPLLRGLFAAPMKAQRPDQLLNKELTEKLFGKAHHTALDLAALNIQRGRDHALPEYMEWRKWCGLSATVEWSELEDITDPSIRDRLKRLYGDPRSIDLWVGGMLENLLPGARVGPTFACIQADQFKRLRSADRFWYESPGVFTPLQLNEIKKSSLAQVLCEDGDDIDRVQEDVFIYPGSVAIENYPSCDRIHRLNLNLWQECCSDSCFSGVPQGDGDFGDNGNDNDIENDLNFHHGAPHSTNRIKRSVLSTINQQRSEHGMEERLEGSLKSEVNRLRSEVRHWEGREREWMGRCKVDGVWKEPGDEWSVDLCTSCQCKDGQVWCKLESCPPVSCKKPVKLPFECCPVCPTD